MGCLAQEEHNRRLTQYTLALAIEQPDKQILNENKLEARQESSIPSVVYKTCLRERSKNEGIRMLFKNRLSILNGSFITYLLWDKSLVSMTGLDASVILAIKDLFRHGKLPSLRF